MMLITAYPSPGEATLVIPSAAVDYGVNMDTLLFTGFTGSFFIELVIRSHLRQTTSDLLSEVSEEQALHQRRSSFLSNTPPFASGDVCYTSYYSSSGVSSVRLSKICRFTTSPLS